MKRESMIFYASFHEAAKSLENDADKAALYDAIFEYALYKNVIELSGTPKAMFTLIKPQLDANIRKYNNGKKPKRKQTASKTEAKLKQTGSKTQGNVNDNVNVNVNANGNEPKWSEFLSYSKTQEPKINEAHLRAKFDQWVEDGWKDGNGKPIKNWKTKIRNTMPFLKKDENKDQPIRAEVPKPPPSYLMED